MDGSRQTRERLSLDADRMQVKSPIPSPGTVEGQPFHRTHGVLALRGGQGKPGENSLQKGAVRPGRPTIPVFLHTLSDGVGASMWGPRGEMFIQRAHQMALVVRTCLPCRM